MNKHKKTRQISTIFVLIVLVLAFIMSFFDKKMDWKIKGLIILLFLYVVFGSGNLYQINNKSFLFSFLLCLWFLIITWGELETIPFVFLCVFTLGSLYFVIDDIIKSKRR